MILLFRGGQELKSKENHIVAVFGIGLIGNHLTQEISRHSYSIAATMPYSWDNAHRRSQENSEIKHFTKKLMNHECASHASGLNCKIDFVWSAGKGGFRMQESEARSEFFAFSDVVGLAVAVAKSHPLCLVRFHMLSSAGGLFEGQRNVGTGSVPCPKRPYGSMKLNQEHLLAACSNIIQFIYRPSSVYGFAGLPHRLGLIPTLLLNGATNRVSSIFGSPDTLRDYVWVKDIVTFITKVILSTTSSSKTYILASGKPSSIFEIKSCIENVLNKKIFCHYLNDCGSNVNDNSFNPNTYPAGWKPTGLATGIRRTFMSIYSDLGPIPISI